jgi:hypothetical protein
VIDHVYKKCDGSCVDDFGGVCFICNGLSVCLVCGGFEGQLLVSCPGKMLSQETLNACYQGNISDFCLLKQWKEAGYNVRKRSWR